MYTAIVLNEFTSKKLIEMFSVGYGRQLAHHMTLHMGSHRADSDPPLGSEILLSIVALGETTGAVRALKVESGGEHSENEIPHITLEVNAPHRPSESNQIQNWVEIPELLIRGIVEECS